MAVKTYSYKQDRGVILTKHFRVGEFRSYNSATGTLTSDVIKIDEALPVMLEKLFEKLDCSKIIVTSGYRSPAFEKLLSGKSTGQHTLGKASDVICYDKSGKKIDPKVVCMTAQDLGFKGIGYMAGGTHLDVRASKSWFDETKGNKVVSDWYSYFGDKKPSGKPAQAPAAKPDQTMGHTELKPGSWNVRRGPSLGSPVARVVTGPQPVTYVRIVPEQNPAAWGKRSFYQLRDGTYLSTKACE